MKKIIAIFLILYSFQIYAEEKSKYKAINLTPKNQKEHNFSIIRNFIADNKYEDNLYIYIINFPHKFNNHIFFQATLSLQSKKGKYLDVKLNISHYEDKKQTNCLISQDKVDDCNIVIWYRDKNTNNTLMYNIKLKEFKNIKLPGSNTK